MTAVEADPWADVEPPDDYAGLSPNPKPAGVQLTWLGQYDPDAHGDDWRATDDDALPVYGRQLTAIVGEGEAGKSWLAAHAALHTTHARQVLIVDGEMNVRSWHRRFCALGATSDQLAAIAYAEMTDQCTDVDVISRTLDQMPTAGLIVWDSALSMLSRTARSENDNAEVARVYDRLRDIVRTRDVGGLIVDHTTRGSGQLVSRGATAKFNALDVSYGVKLADGSIPGPLDDWSSTITVEKDRHGLLGARRDREALFHPLGLGNLHLDIHETQALTSRLLPAADLLAQIASLDPPPTSANDAARRIRGTRTAVLAAYRDWKDA